MGINVLGVPLSPISRYAIWNILLKTSLSLSRRNDKDNELTMFQVAYRRLLNASLVSRYLKYFNAVPCCQFRTPISIYGPTVIAAVTGKKFPV
jgi:hypothetical protein